jgi:hypothetical protein
VGFFFCVVGCLDVGVFCEMLRVTERDAKAYFRRRYERSPALLMSLVIKRHCFGGFYINHQTPSFC